MSDDVDTTEATPDEATCTTCDGQNYVTDADDRLTRCPDCSERDS